VTALYLRFHRWRGFPLEPDEPDLFHAQIPLGFATLFICKECLIETRRKLRAAIAERIAKDEEGR